MDGAAQQAGALTAQFGDFALPSSPPKSPPAVRGALVANPTAEALNSHMNPLPQRSQKNWNW